MPVGQSGEYVNWGLSQQGEGMEGCQSVVCGSGAGHPGGEQTVRREACREWGVGTPGFNGRQRGEILKGSWEGVIRRKA